MFGYIYVNEQELKIREFTAYRSFYCGLCRTLHLKYGRIAQMMLNYDLTFLALLLTELYEVESRADRRRCLIHPIQKHQSLENEALAYAADMCVLLSYHKCKDNWADDHSIAGRAAMMLLEKDYRRLKIQYQRQSAAIEENVKALRQAEEQHRDAIDEIAGFTGRFLAEVFVWKDDIWQEDLRKIGFYLGKYIYVLDALDDYPKDMKHHNYNLFQNWEEISSQKVQKKIYDILADMMQHAAQAFERLPIVGSNVEILRNILYSGVWCKYALAAQKYQKIDRKSEEE